LDNSHFNLSREYDYKRAVVHKIEDSSRIIKVNEISDDQISKWQQMRQQSAFSIATNPEMDDQALFNNNEDQSGKSHNV
jgi:hypothetical protein